MRTVLALLLLTVAACDYTEPSRIVGGVDLDLLFAPPTASEIATVEADWDSRTPVATGTRIEYLRTASVSDRTVQVMVVSHRVDGLRHYGAVIFPDGADPGSLPVMVYLHGGDAGVSVDEVIQLFELLPATTIDFVTVIPSFRDERLRFDDRSWISDGPASPWDRDVDDAMSLLSVTFDVAPAADPSRVAVVGFSRGAGVGLLMGIRDDRIDRVVEFFGPTDFFGPFVQDVSEEVLQGNPRDLPGLEFLSEEFLLPLSRGEVTMATVRTELVRRSPVLFVDAMPPVQLHHGTADSIVPVGQAEALIQAMDRAGKPETEFQGYLYDGGQHNPITLTGSFDRAFAFLEPLTNAP